MLTFCFYTFHSKVYIIVIFLVLPITKLNHSIFFRMYHLLFYNTNDEHIASHTPFLGIAKPCTHLYTATSISTQFHPPPPSSIRFHPAHFNLHPALCSIFNFIRTKILPGQFPQIWVEKLKVAHFD